MLSQALKAIREFHALSLTKLANDLHISKSYISEIENNKKEPSIDVLRSYSKYFDLPLSSILFFAENISRDQNFLARQSQKILSEKIIDIIKFLNRHTKI